MKLYNKKLTSLSDLEREKKRIRKEIEKLNQEEIFSVQEILANNPLSALKSGGFNISSLLGMLPASNPIVSSVIGIIKARLAKQKSNKADEADAPTTPPLLTRAKTAAKNAAIEVITGYLKWKAIELTYKGVKYYITKRKTDRFNEDDL